MPVESSAPPPEAGPLPRATRTGLPESATVLLPLDKELVMKVIPMPADCNANGDIFGGWVMAQVDLAGAVLPARYVDGRMATVAVNQFIFKHPVRVGDILSFFSSVTRIGTTSITVQVEVFAEHFNAQKRYMKVTEASVTYVAIDSSGRPRKIRVDAAEAGAAITAQAIVSAPG
jgi:acyl-CoA thioesterase YciA